MADSWEDDLDQQPRAQASSQRAPATAGLNPNASSFSFNPSASTFTPNFAPRAQAPTPAAQPVQESAAPASAQAPASSQQADHSATNGTVDHTQSAQQMQIDPPSEREMPVATASTSDQDVDQDMQEADGQASAGTEAEWLQACRVKSTVLMTPRLATTAAESTVESVTADIADMKVSEPAPAPSKPAPDVSTSMAAKHDEDYPHEEETAEERAKREAELQKIYADLAKEDDRCSLCAWLSRALSPFC